MMKNIEIAAILIITLFSSDIHAQGRSDEDFHDYGISTYGVFVSATTITSAVFLFGNIRYITFGHKSSSVWETGGWISGTLSMVVGVISLMEIIDSVDKDVLLTFGLVSTIGGALTIGATIWASKLSSNEENKLSISPMVIPDSQGKLAMGMGVRFVGW